MIGRRSDERALRHNLTLPANAVRLSALLPVRRRCGYTFYVVWFAE